MTLYNIFNEHYPLVKPIRL